MRSIRRSVQDGLTDLFFLSIQTVMMAAIEPRTRIAAIIMGSNAIEPPDTLTV
jgi:hypothetical protein